LNSNQSWDSPKPSTDYEPGRPTHLAFALLVCRLLRFGDLGTNTALMTGSSD
jgi:hypothetical protein